MKKWIITDTHWNHKNIIKYENRPVNFNTLINENWRKLVRYDDTVIHLGDVIFGQVGTLDTILISLPGTKILCMGNHDREKPGWYERKGFSRVEKYFIEDEILFSHKPMDIKMISSIEDCEIKYNIHGHFHKRDREQEGRKSKDYPFYGKNHLLLSIEEQNYKPILIEDLLKQYGKI